MSVKNRILSIISIFALAIMLTLVGIWAVTDLDFIVGGDITYTAPEKGYTISLEFQTFGASKIECSVNEREYENCSTLTAGKRVVEIENVSSISFKNVSSDTCELATSENFIFLYPNQETDVIKITIDGYYFAFNSSPY